MHARQSIERLIASEHTDAALRSQLAAVREARDFASQALGLPDNASYRTYSALGRPYVVWNVVAAPEFSVEPRQWCFPITGCIAYRGYFRERSAQRYAGQLRQQGNDVLVAGVSAYSTLGRFADPVLDTMMRYGELELISTIFHELAHQRVYVKNDSEFNESFAMTVEQVGLERWLAAHDRSAELQAYLEHRQWQRTTVEQLAAARRELAMLYATAEPADQKRLHKQQLLRNASESILSSERARGARSGYDAWLDAGLNNAHLAAVATYHACIPAFQRLLAREQGDLAAFYAAAAQLGREKAAGRRRFCAAG
jgi:predicted aminopeptidase